MIVLHPKFFVLLSVTFGVLLSALAVAPGLLDGNDKVIKKVPTTHKVVSL